MIVRVKIAQKSKKGSCMADSVVSAAAYETKSAFDESLPSLGKQPFESPSLLQRIGYVLTNPGKNHLIPCSLLRALLKTSRSPLIKESFVRPGGWRSMEIVYKNAPPVDWLDRQALPDNPITMAARNRRKIIVDRLSRLIRQHDSVGHVNLLGIGAGPGRLLQTAMSDAKIDPSRMTAYLIDLDEDACQFGQTLASNFGLLDRVKFITGDARQIRDSLPGVGVNIVKLVGIIEYLDDAQLVEMLNAVRTSIVPGGNVVTHGFVDKYGTGRFFARVFGLRHHQRNAEYLTSILKTSGFRVTECEYEPTGIHPIMTAVRVD
jgi:predicted RNA methylase